MDEEGIKKFKINEQLTLGLTQEQYDSIVDESVAHKLIEQSTKSIFLGANQQPYKPTKAEQKYIAKLQKRIDRIRPEERLWQKWHKVIKVKFAKKGLGWLKKRIGNVLIQDTDNIPNTYYNAFIRMFHWTAHKSLDNEWLTHEYQMNHAANGDKITAQEHLALVKGRKDLTSYNIRQFIVNMVTTECMQDTVDREWINEFMYLIYNTMYEHFDGKLPERLPQYMAGTAYNPGYHINDLFQKKWSPNEEDRTMIVSKKHYENMKHALKEMDKELTEGKKNGKNKQEENKTEEQSTSSRVHKGRDTKPIKGNRSRKTE